MQLLAPILNSAAAPWFSYMYHVAWQASLLAVLLIVIVRLGRRWPSPLRYWLLILALAKFALPPLLSLPTGLFTHVGPTVQAVPVEANVPTIARASPASFSSPTPLAGVPVGLVDSNPLPKQTTSTPEPHSPAPVLYGKAWLMLLHGGGALEMAVWVLKSLLAMRRTLRRAAEVPDGELRRRFIRLSEQLGLRRPPRLLLSHEPCGPAACGVLRPVVILPDAVASLEATALDAILAHELAHHRRRDLWINWLQLALTAVWWFNPVIWILNRQIRKVREDCCDDLLLTRKLTTCQAYCDTLLSAASKLTVRETAGVALGFGDRLHPLGRRFERIMDQTLRRAPRLSFAGILFVAVLACVVLPGLRQSDGDEPVDPALGIGHSALGIGARESDGGQPAAPATPVATAADAKDSEPAAKGTTKVWLEGATVTGRVLDHRGAPVVNAEVLLLGQERIFVDADRRNWFVLGKDIPNPPSTRTDKQGGFTITRKQGTSDRLAVIAEDPLFWVVSRESLKQDRDVEIKLPIAGSLAVHCDFPGKPSKLPVNIELKSFDGVTWNADVLRFHFSTFRLANPGETVFEHLPPGQFAVQRHEETKTSGNSVLMSGADRELVEIESAKRANIKFDRKTGQPLSGQVRGLENVELREAHLTISHLGPEEVLGNDGKRNRMYVAFDVIPVTSEGRFTTDPMPPGKYTARLFAVLAAAPRGSSQYADFSGELSFTVPEQGEMPKVEIAAKANRTPKPPQTAGARLRVVDEEGQPLSKLEGMVHTADQGYGPWLDSRDGNFFLGGGWDFRGAPNSAAALQVLVRADGYASTIARFAGEQRNKLSKGESAVTLRRGQPVQLRFNLPHDMTWPKGTLPEVYFDDLQERVRIMRQPVNRRADMVSDFNMLNLREVGAGRFEFRLAAETPRFHVAIHAPGFLQCFETGPFTLADVKDGALEIDVPRPAAVDVSFEPGDYPGASVPFKSAGLDVSWQLHGNSFLNVTSETGPSLTPKLKVTDLAPGHYSISVRTQPREESKPLKGTEINVGAYFDQRMLRLKAGQSERIAFRSTPYDPNAFRGTRTAVVHIRTPDGKPARDRKASVVYVDGHYGAQAVFSGPVPASGDIVLTGITDTALPQWYPFPAYSVSVDDKRLGAFGFAKEPATEQFEFTLAPIAGDMAPDVELTNLATGKAMRLRSLRGKVVFLEFWATWCGPCQQPMTNLNALGIEQSAAWKERVVLVPVSIDAEPGHVKSHVQQRGWSGLEFCWSGGSKGGDFECDAARAFGLYSVPEAVMIDPAGRILWRGHPLDKSDGKDVKSRIEDALK